MISNMLAHKKLIIALTMLCSGLFVYPACAQEEPVPLPGRKPLSVKTHVPPQKYTVIEIKKREPVSVDESPEEEVVVTVPQSKPETLIVEPEVVQEVEEVVEEIKADLTEDIVIEEVVTIVPVSKPSVPVREVIEPEAEKVVEEHEVFDVQSLSADLTEEFKKGEFQEIVIQTQYDIEWLFHVQNAQTTRQQAQGLMNVKELPYEKGMLFSYKEPRVIKMWMKSTHVPLDMIFISPQGRIVEIVKNAQPFDETPVGPDIPVLAVLEINGGLCDELGISVGDKVLHATFQP